MPWPAPHTPIKSTRVGIFLINADEGDVVAGINGEGFVHIICVLGMKIEGNINVGWLACCLDAIKVKTAMRLRLT